MTVEKIQKQRRQKKAKCRKKCFIKRKLKFGNYQNCLEATKLENKQFIQKKNKTDIDSIRNFVKNKKSILKNTNGLKVKETIFSMK